MKVHLQKVWCALVILLAVCMTCIPSYIIFSGSYKWQVTQPEFIQGGIEVLIFTLLMLLTLKGLSGKKAEMLLVLGAIYLSLNGVIIPFVVDYLYFEILIYIGATINSLKSNTKCLHRNLIENFISGISVWGAGAVICSLMNYGTINDLRIYTFFLFILCLYLSREKNYENLYQKFVEQTGKYGNGLFQAIGFSLLCMIVLMLFAKTNSAIDYDSLWYGLRPEKVLVGKNSFYDYLGFGASVYYYPKLMELLYLPISNLGDYSFLQGANIFVFIFIIVEIVTFIDRMYDKYQTKFSLFFALVLVSIPALGNTAATAKPDILGMFFVLVALEYLYVYFKTRSGKKLAFGMLALLFCTGTKITYFLWGGIAFLITVLFLCINRKKIFYKDLIISDKINIVLGCICILGVHYRTYKLTGYLIYPLLTSVFDKLGMHAKNFISIKRVGPRTENVTWQLILERIYNFIFDPNPLGHVIMLWTSSVVFFVIVLYVLRLKKNFLNIRKEGIESKYAITMTVVYIGVMLYYMCLMPIPDGNYFILPIVFVSICLGKYICPKGETTGGVKHTSNLCILLFLLLHLPILFVSHSSWQYGTRAFDSELIVDNFETKTKNENAFLYNGVSQITKYVSTFENTPEERFLSSASATAVHFRFPCAVEGGSELESTLLSGEKIMGSYKDFVKYVDEIDIKGFILFNDDVSKYADYVKQYTNEHQMTKVISDTKAVYYERR